MTSINIQVRTLALIAAVSLCACQPEPMVMTPQETQRVSELTSRMELKCVGRLLVEMPSSFVLNSESAAEIDKVSISVHPTNRAKFDGYVERRAAELRASTLMGLADTGLKSEEPLPDEMGVVFDRSRTFESNVLRTLELQAWRDGYRIQATVDGRDMSFSKSTGTDDARQSDMAEARLRLLAIFNRVRGRVDSEIPGEPGLCIANGFIKGPPGPADIVQMAYHLERERDVWFTVLTRTDLYEQETMLQRSSKIEADMRRSGIKTIRKGARVIAKQGWEEWLMAGPVENNLKGVSFTLIANETSRLLNSPFTTFDFFTGKSIPRPATMTDADRDRLGLNAPLKQTGLSDAESVAVWDAVTATIRPRPGAF